MNNKITTEEVAQQFARSIQILLEWVEQRENAITRDISKPKDDEFAKHELLKAAEAVKTLRISKSMMYQ